MDRLGVVGKSWRQGGLAALTPFTLPPEERPLRVPALASEIGVSELVYLGTCNRVEVAFVARRGTGVSAYRRAIFEALTGRAPRPGEAERELRAWEGEGAAEHVFLVATGLESARVGETEIAGQVRDALQLSRSLELAGDRLGVLFDEALKLARRTHLHTGIGAGRTSLAEIALEHVRLRLGHAGGVVALVGVSPMTERCGHALAQEGVPLVVVNRREENAAALSGRLGTNARSLGLDRFRIEPPPVAAVIAATGAPGVVLDRSALTRLREAAGYERPPLLVDFATRPDLDPDAARALGLERIGIEEITAAAARTREHRVIEAAEARDLVDQALATLSRALASKAVNRAIAALHRRYESTALEQAERLIRAKFPELEEDRRDLLRRFVSRLARHFAHLPATGLRETAATHGPRFLETYFAHADENLGAELDVALDDDQLFAAVRAGYLPEEQR